MSVTIYASMKGNTLEYLTLSHFSDECNWKPARPQESTCAESTVRVAMTLVDEALARHPDLSAPVAAANSKK